ncbi:hypothetical protein MFLAVUS_001258 [Mucor flavus]|uniref:HIG1 domain-containing protein n=1 Tax=Mucor flavus TaxID=439312 RepID=A0ABP9YLY6_9FUNG
MTKLLSKEQEKTSEKIFFQSGLKGAAVGLGLGLVATALTIRKSPDFRALSRPYQAIMAASGSVAGFLFAADKAVSKYEMDVLGYTDEDMLRELRSNRVPDANLSTIDRSLRYLNDNRWSFIGVSWAASMVGALGYSFSNKYLTTQQKVVQARMYAQAVTIAVLMVSASVSMYVGDEGKNRKEQPDAQLRAVLELPDSISPKHESKMVKQSS